MKYTLVSRVKMAIREYGVGALAWLLAGRALHLLSAGHARIVPYVIVAQPIGARTSSAVRDDPDTVTALIDRHDGITASFPRDTAILQRRFAAGARCYATRCKGAFAGHIWISSGHHVEDEVRCVYQLPKVPRSVWDFDVFVAERFRLGRTMARMWSSVENALAAEGVAWTFSRISMFNPASLASHRKLGAVKTRTIVFLLF